MSWFRTFSTLSASFYSFLIFPHSERHSTEIFVGAALLYLVGFGLMCWNVREGQYPPAPPLLGGQTGPIAAVKTYGKETHAFAHYWYLWIATFIGGLGNANNIYGQNTVFGIYYCMALGLTVPQIGIVWGCLGLTISILTPVAGWLADRYHPLRVVLASSLAGFLLGLPANLSWLFWHPAPVVAFWVYLIINICLVSPLQALGGMWDPPMLMRLFPRSHFGQFCSINAVWRSVGGMISALISGTFLEVITHWVGKDRAYLYLPVWGLVFSIPSLCLMIKLYFSWKKHGGDAAYIAPVLASGPGPAPTTPMPILPRMEN
jgi:MFS family permease